MAVRVVPLLFLGKKEKKSASFAGKESGAGGANDVFL
jgi:hypothetical protein